MNRQEIEWITQNLFVGNRLWSGEVRGATGRAFDLREIRSPIILFASLGDNITPPQQAFNWVADVYGSTAEIKAQGRVIVGLVHQDIGHLGIFVSGRVAKKEYTQIVSVLKSIETLPPGVYGMQILDRRTVNGKPEYDVQFVEHSLEEISERLNRFKRVDEKPFEAVQKIANFNQHAYELFARPLVEAISNELTARVSRALHPLRVQQWGISDLNPWLAWLGPAAAMVKGQRQKAADDAPARRIEHAASELASASLDFYREIRDAVSEVLFFQIYGNLFSFYLAGDTPGIPEKLERPSHNGELALTQRVVASFDKGGYPEAVARVFALLALRGKPFPLALLNLKQEIVAKYPDLLPNTTLEQQRPIRGMQDLIVHHDCDRALATLPALLKTPGDRRRLLTLLERAMAEEGVRQLDIVPEQFEMLRRIRQVLSKAVRPPAKPRGETKPTQRRRSPQPA
jgi:hypothetical protein